jgi:hypothetical protein
MKIKNIEEFKEELLTYVNDDKLFIIQKNNITKIEELQESGKGEIYAVAKTDSFIQIIPSSDIAIGRHKQNNDGILISVDFAKKNIDIYLFELKKQLRFQNLEKATKQLYMAYIFIKYLNLECCFNVNYSFFVATKENNLKKNYQVLKNLSPYQMKLFESVYENKEVIPIMQIFCKYKEFKFKLLNFGEIIEI